MADTILPRPEGRPIGSKTRGASLKQRTFYSPELEGLKKSYLSRDWFAQQPYTQKLGGYMDQLAAPVQTPIGMTDPEREGIYNLARRQIQGSTNTAADQMRQAMLKQGFAVGESGVANSAIAPIYRQGQEQLGQLGTQIALDEAQNRFNQGIQLENLNLQRLLGAGKFAELMGSQDIAQQGLGLEALTTGGNLEQVQKQLEEQRRARAASSGMAQQRFAYQKEQDAIDNLMNYWQLVNGQQNQAWNPYWGAIAQSYS